MLFFYRINLVLFSLITGLPLSLRTMRIGWVEQHGCADAILTFGAFQDIVVHATVATPPESLIVRQVGERNRYISQLGIHLHHGSAGGKAEYLCFRPAHAGKLEGHVFDAFRYTQAPEIRMHDQAGGSHVLLVSP